MNDIDDQFLIEARELLTQAGDDLLALERDALSPQRVNHLFRALHTLKGSAGIMGLAPLGFLMHAAEDLLGEWRSGQAEASPELVNWLLATLDQTDQWLDNFEVTGRFEDVASEEAATLVGRLAALRGDEQAEPTVEPPDWAAPLLESLNPAPSGQLVAIEYEPRARCFFDGDDPIDFLRRLPGLVAVQVEAREDWASVEDLDPFACNIRFRALAKADITEVRAMFRFVADQVRIAGIDIRPRDARLAIRSAATAVLEEQRRLLAHDVDGVETAGRSAAAARVAANALRALGETQEAARVEAAGRAAVEAGTPAPLLSALTPATAQSLASGAPDLPATALRVDPARVDDLADLVGELIVAKNALAHLVAQRDRAADAATILATLEEQVARIERLTAGLQRSVLAVRLMSVGPVFRRFPRVVRDAARLLGKEVGLVVSGESVEIDKAIVDMLFEPLLHLVRNALDHGIETTPARRAAGKPDRARIELRAVRTRAGVAVEVEDDGRGIDPVALRRTAVERRLLSAEHAAALTDEEALRLVFLPGLSTAAELTDLSGRGVGMDAVRSAVEAVGGRVRLSSVPGRGTTCRIELPVGLISTRLLVVRVGEDRFGLPMDRSAETLRLPRGSVQGVLGGSAFVLRDRTVPFLRLASLLGLSEERDEADPLVIVVETPQGPLGLGIDAIEERLDAVVKPPEGLVSALPYLLGTTLRGDGRVLLVLDPESLVQ